MVQVPAMEPVHAVQSLVALRTLRTLIAVVTLRTLRAVVAAIALVSLRALRSHPAVVAAITLRASGAVRALAVEHVARAVPIHVLGLEVAVTVLIQVPAIHSVNALRAGVAFRPLRTGYAGVAFHSQRAGYAQVAFRARRPDRALWAGRPGGTDRSRGTGLARCAHPRRRRHGQLSLEAGREPEMDLRVFQLAAVVHERAGRLGLRGGAPADAGHREHCERQGQFARLHAIYPFSFV